jgi:hypothetical protein
MTVMPHPARVIVASILVLGGVALHIARGEAHKAITSKYTYNDDVFPIFRDRCSQCHVTGGVAPMSLMTYDEAFPWAESIRAELIASHMPPWNADDNFGELKRAHTLSSKELDVIMTWASGGNPRGGLDRQLPEVTLRNEWTMGAPDLALPLPSAVTLAADKMEETREFTLTTGLREARWVRAVDLLPGTPSIVRSAVVFVKGDAAPGDSTAPERVLARWIPGLDAEPIDNGAAFRLPAGAELVARIHYKKTWQFEGKPLSDRSTVGVYFAGENADELLRVPITAPPAAGADTTIREVVFRQTINEDMQALALSPEQVPPNITLQVEAVRPDGSRTPMIRLNTRPDWGRRYWFERPLALPRGTSVEVTASFDRTDVLGEVPAAGRSPGPAPIATALRLSLNVIQVRPQRVAPGQPRHE